jgi:hypothetical protein
MKLFTVILLAVVAAGCGYSKPAMPAQGAMPAIAQLVPTSMAADSSTFMLEVEGTNFGAAAMVNFNGRAVTTAFVSGTKLMATIPASALMNSGTVPVTVTNPGGMYSGGTMPVTSSPVNFTIN